MNEAIDYYMRHGFTLEEATEQAELDRDRPEAYNVLLQSNRTGHTTELYHNLTEDEWDTHFDTVLDTIKTELNTTLWKGE